MTTLTRDRLRTRRRVLAPATGVLLAGTALLAACGPAGGTAPGGGSARKVPVRFATWSVGEQDGSELQALVSRVNEAARSYELTWEPTPDYYTKLRTQLAGGGAADVFWLDQENAVPLAEDNHLLDLTGRVTTTKAPAAAHGDYFPEALKPYQWRSKLYGLPWIAQPVILFANLDLFARAGLQPPDPGWDWTTFIEAAGKLTRAEEGTYGVEAQTWPPAEAFVWQAGGEVIAPDLKSCPIDAAPALEGQSLKPDLLLRYRVAPDEAATKAAGGLGKLMEAGKVGMFMGGAADGWDRNPSFRGQGFLLPKHPRTGQRTTWAWIGGSSLNAQTRVADAAFAAFLDLTEAIQRWKIPAPRKSLATAEQITKAQPQKAVSMEAIVAAMPTMRGARVFPKFGQWATLYRGEFEQPALQGSRTVPDLAREVRPKLEALLPQ
ncbi:MAG TPA: extracellular solute-binding protein [Chloroflexota bacterium]|nr:extracellular solute-binding protein [Chloroflexota bacterium]